MRILFLIFALLANFHLTTKDGHVYHYNTASGLEDVHDRNGVSLTYMLFSKLRS